MSEPFTHKLYAIVDALHEAKISHSLVITRDDAITILAAVPGGRWEIDVFSDGRVEVEVFRSTGGIVEEDELTRMIREFSD